MRCVFPFFIPPYLYTQSPGFRPDLEQPTNTGDPGASPPPRPLPSSAPPSLLRVLPNPMPTPHKGQTIAAALRPLPSVGCRPLPHHKTTQGTTNTPHSHSQATTPPPPHTRTNEHTHKQRHKKQPHPLVGNRCPKNPTPEFFRGYPTSVRKQQKPPI